MTPVDRQTVARKLGYLQRALEKLVPYGDCTAGDLEELSEKRLAVERLLQTAIESVLDIGRILVIVENWRELRDERDALVILMERGVIDEDLAIRLQRAKGFRNILVHEYVEVDPVLLAEFLQKDVQDLQGFAIALAEWIRTHP